MFVHVEGLVYHATGSSIQHAACSMQSIHCMHKCHESCKLGTELVALYLQETCNS